jgi:hypothetical protein
MLTVKVSRLCVNLRVEIVLVEAESSRQGLRGDGQLALSLELTHFQAVNCMDECFSELRCAGTTQLSTITNWQMLSKQAPFEILKFTISGEHVAP